MTRRDFLLASAAASATSAAGVWRTFEVKTSVELVNAVGLSRIWLPAALIRETRYQKTISNEFSASAGTAKLTKTHADGLGIVIAEFAASARPVLTLTSRITTKNFAVEFGSPSNLPTPSRAELEHFLRPTKLLPTNGIVQSMASEITASAKSDLEKARAIYNWIVDNTFRDPQTRGCGVGNIKFMLESRDPGGKCADLNALFVGLARAAGLPARDVYGIRVAKSNLGYTSLGTSSEVITKAQHCRAEVHLSGYGWVPVDPADVRKVALEEPPGNRPLNDAIVRKARALLFGTWEMNWIAYNFAHDVILPGSTKGPLGFFMYPQAETAAGRVDPLDPEKFRYSITARELAS